MVLIPIVVIVVVIVVIVFVVDAVVIYPVDIDVFNIERDHRLDNSGAVFSVAPNSTRRRG